MDSTDQVCALLRKKRELFLRYEEVTYGIAAGDAEGIADCMQERTRIQSEIGELDEALRALWGEDGQLLAAASTRCARGELPEELRPVFDCGMAVRAVMVRIREIEPQALERATEERDGLLERIKSVNQGTGAAASKYYRSTSPREAEERQRTVKKV